MNSMLRSEKNASVWAMFLRFSSSSGPSRKIVERFFVKIVFLAIEVRYSLTPFLFYQQ